MNAPSGCAHCGVEQRGHCRRWTDAAGWHSWTAPTSEQIKTRMIARRPAPSPEETPR